MAHNPVIIIATFHPKIDIQGVCFSQRYLQAQLKATQAKAKPKFLK